MSRPLFWLLLLLAIPISLALWVRLAPSDPARWHVDPEAEPDPQRPNFARLDTVIGTPTDVVATRLAERTRAEGALRIAGDDLHGTWLTRSPLMRYPDYISIRLVPAEGGTRVQALARARFGHSDLGKNRERLDRWLAAMRHG